MCSASVSCCFLSWIAVSTGDRAGVMDLLGLSDPRPVPFAAGVFAADVDSHAGLDEDPLDRYRRVFVTPELAGWTLVVGAVSIPMLGQADSLNVALSAGILLFEARARKEGW